MSVELFVREEGNEVNGSFCVLRINWPERGVIEGVRAQRPPSSEAQLAQQIEEVHQAKELAIETQDFQTAAAMRDQERELVPTVSVMMQLR